MQSWQKCLWSIIRSIEKDKIYQMKEFHCSLFFIVRNINKNPLISWAYNWDNEEIEWTRRIKEKILFWMELYFPFGLNFDPFSMCDAQLKWIEVWKKFEPKSEKQKKKKEAKSGWNSFESGFYWQRPNTLFFFINDANFLFLFFFWL